MIAILNLMIEILITLSYIKSVKIEKFSPNPQNPFSIEHLLVSL